MKRLATTFAILTVVATAAPAAATTVQLLNLDQLITGATHVVEGEVIDGVSLWRGKLLVTRVQLRVQDCMKGSCGETTMNIDVLGGEQDGLAMVVEGSPRFSPGENVVLFLQPVAAGTFRTVGMAQGKFVVGQAADEADPELVRDLSGLVLDSGRVSAAHNEDPFSGLRLSDIKRQVVALGHPSVEEATALARRVR